MSPSDKVRLDPHEAYRGARIAFLTQHGKETLLQPVMAAALGCQLERVTGFDTDLLGTVTREIPREGSQLDAARTKARTGMELSGCLLGLASEGSFGPDPFTGFIPWNVEVVTLIDDLRGLEVTGIAAGAALNQQALVRDEDALRSFALNAGFPEHHLVIRINDEHGEVTHKGIHDPALLVASFHEALAGSATGQVMIENDLRAHCNPTRQAIIRQAGENLLERLFSACPSCHAPGYWKSGVVEGLPCGWCRRPTREPVAERWACAHCGHNEEKGLGARAHADPSRCAHCNP